MIPAYLSNLSKSMTVKSLVTSDGHRIDVWELKAPTKSRELSVWASAFRQNYCPDAEIDDLREGTGLSRAEYLIDMVFPDERANPGPGIRAGDFAEILVSDYVEHLLGYWVPRGKYAGKASRNESVKGVDILGFFTPDPATPTRSDTLMAFEVKAQFSGSNYAGILQKAIDDSSKDYLRRATTLNATKRRLLAAGEQGKALVVQRFQNLADHPYIYRSGAAAVLSKSAYDKAALQGSTKVTGHQNQGNLELLVIRGKDLLTLVHSLYQTAANEA